MSVLAYKKQKVNAGWTRVDLLLYLYDRTILSLEASETAQSEGDVAGHAKHLIHVNKGLTALYGGLKPEADEVAFNVARLLHFVAEAVIKSDYRSAIKVLSSLRNGFAAVADEVNELECKGLIPSIPIEDAYLA